MSYTQLYFEDSLIQGLTSSSRRDYLVPPVRLIRFLFEDNTIQWL